MLPTFSFVIASWRQKADKLVPSQCAAASADRFPVKRLTSARAARARKPAQLKLLGELTERLGVVALLVEKLESRVAYCFDLGRCSSKKTRKSMAYKLLAVPKGLQG